MHLDTLSPTMVHAPAIQSFVNAIGLQITLLIASGSMTIRAFGPGKDNLMFGRMMVTLIMQVGADANLKAGITALLQAAEQVKIVRWIEFPASVLLFLLMPGDPESGAVYILDRKQGTWYAVDFDDEQFGGYSISHFEQLLRECRFLDLVERPGLWRAGLSWWVEPGKVPQAHV